MAEEEAIRALREELVRISRKSKIPLETLRYVFGDRLYGDLPPLAQLKRVVEPTVRLAKNDKLGIFRGKTSLSHEQLQRLESAREILGEKEAINRTQEGAILRSPVNPDRLAELAQIVDEAGAAKAKRTLDALRRHPDFYLKYRPDLRAVHGHAGELKFITEFGKALDSVSRHTRFPDPRELKFPAGHTISQPILNIFGAGESLGNMQIVVRPYGVRGIPPGVLEEQRHGPNIGFHQVLVGELGGRRVLYFDTSQTDMLRGGVPKQVSEYYTKGKNEWINHSIPAIEEALRRANRRLPPKLRVHAIVVPELDTLRSYKRDTAEKMRGKYAQSLYTEEKLGKLGFSAEAASVLFPHTKRTIAGRFLVKRLK